MKRILLVEDDYEIAGSLLIALGMIETPPLEKEAQYEGVSALGRIQSPPAPDLLVLDMHLPNLTGQTIYEEIREKIPSCKVIVITGDDRLAGKIKARLGDWERLDLPEASPA